MYFTKEIKELIFLDFFNATTKKEINSFVNYTHESTMKEHRKCERSGVIDRSVEVILMKPRKNGDA